MSTMSVDHSGLATPGFCGECFAQWCDPDAELVYTPDFESIGTFVRLKHGLPPLAASLAILLLAMTSTAQASRRCLDRAEAARTWPTRMLAQDGDGCWTYDHHPPPTEAPASMPDTVMPGREPTLLDRWPDTTTRQFALIVSFVLAAWSVVEVATGG